MVGKSRAFDYSSNLLMFGCDGRVSTRRLNMLKASEQTNMTKEEKELRTVALWHLVAVLIAMVLALIFT